jgi:hypothetical protein
MYFSSEGASNSNHSFIGNIIQLPFLNSTTLSSSSNNNPNSYIKRTVSQISNNSNKQQAPTLPPPLPPPLKSNFYNLELPLGPNANSNIQTQIGHNQEIGEKSKDNRFSTFKSNINATNNGNKSNTKSDSLTESSTLQNKRLYNNYDENQYLTPEYHSYSVVDNFNSNNDATNRNNAESDDSENEDALEDDMSNNYVEVIDEYNMLDQRLG